MVDWQVTATTIFCEEVNDEVTIIVSKDGSVRCVGSDRYGDTGRLMKQKSAQRQRRPECTGTGCRHVTDYRDRLFAEEAEQSKPGGSS